MSGGVGGVQSQDCPLSRLCRWEPAARAFSKQQSQAVRVGHLNGREDTPVTDIDALIATAATVAIVAITLLAAHPEILILVPTS